MHAARSLLWIDSGAGLIAGTLTLAFARWLSARYALSVTLVVVMGIANIAFGSFSSALARRSIRPRSLVLALVAANGAWAALCILLAIVLADTASAFGVGQLLAEGGFVGGLAALEWRHRDMLLTATS